METLATDVVILGVGTAGLNARREVERAGKRWIMVQEGPYGTTCARVGCMPSKLLIAAADAVHGIGHAELFGVHVDASAVRIDGREVMARVQRERDRFVGFVLDDQSKLPPELNVLGHARFVAPTTVVVDDHTRIEARAAVIATGSLPTLPAELAAAGLGDRLLTNDRIFELPDLPRSVAVVGVGVIGLELGQALHRLGVRTMLLSRRGSIAGLTDPKVREKAMTIFQKELHIVCDAALTGAERDGDGVRIRWRAGGKDYAEHFDYVLAATGRHPAVADLGLETTGLARDAGGLPLTDPTTMQCGDAPIFLAGDVAAHRGVLHEAVDEGRIAGRNAARFPEVVASPRRTIMAVTFSDPNIALVGLRHADLHPREHAVGEVSFDGQGRSRVAGKNAGLMRLYGERGTNRLLGAEMVGPRMEHLAHLIAWVIQQGLAVDEILALPFYHPVYEEGLRTGLQDLRRQLG
ncbi:MAG: dihydrolipoyl dehydrogenase [Myxococcota bacterium]